METKNNISTSEIDKELLDKVKLAVRYGYSYRKVAQAQFNKTSKINYCIPEASDILIELGSLILSGVAWDSIKAIAKSIYSNYKKSNKINKRTYNKKYNMLLGGKFYEKRSSSSN